MHMKKKEEEKQPKVLMHTRGNDRAVTETIDLHSIYARGILSNRLAITTVRRNRRVFMAFSSKTESRNLKKMQFVQDLT